MSGLEFGLAVLGLVGVIDVCYDRGISLVKSCQAFRQADKRLHEHSVRLEAVWVRYEDQLRVVRGLEKSMDQRHRDSQKDLIEVLDTKIALANSKLSGMIKTISSDGTESEKFRRWKYTFRRDGLIEAIADLESWQGVFDPSFYLLVKNAGSEADTQLDAVIKQQSPGTTKAKSDGILPTARQLRGVIKATDDSEGSPKPTMFFRPDGLIPDSLQTVPFSPISTARRAKNGQLVLLDPVDFQSRPSTSAVLKDIRILSRRLEHADPFIFGMLECKGILKDEMGTFVCQVDKTSKHPNLAFAFRLPESHSKIESLRSCLLHRSSEEQYGSLSDRFALGRQLVRAVSYVHTYGFVHKNIRPENILIISREVDHDSQASTLAGLSEPMETAVLVGFDAFRNADGKSNRRNDDNWTKDIYRHPFRRGATPKDEFEMRHDIYSIGICLLEIGLWENFVDYHEKSGSDGEATHSKESAYTTQPGPSLREAGNITSPKSFEDLEAFKNHLLKLARGKLRHRMGTRYSNVVETCLTCLDADNEDFGDEEEFQDQDGIAVGVRYVEKVVRKLGEISV